MCRRILAAFSLALALVGSTTLARASALSVRTIEFGSWPAAVSAMQARLDAQGSVLHVFVRDEAGRPVACSDYSLVLDEIAARAFAILECDAQTSATALRLDHRTALFTHDDIVPHPLAAGITATEVRTTTARGGGESAVGGTDLSCTLALRPFLTNLETGERVYIQPGRFAMRVATPSFETESAPHGGWLLRTHTRGNLSVEYDVVDRMRHERVLHERVTLRCGIDDADAPPDDSDANAPRVVPSSDPFVAIDPALVPRPALMEGGRRCTDAPSISARGVESTTHGGAAMPLFRVDLSRRTTVHVHLSSGFGGQLFWFRGCGTNSVVAESGVFGGGDDQEIRFPLESGTYFLSVVDADIHAHEGTFTLRYETVDDWL